MADARLRTGSYVSMGPPDHEQLYIVLGTGWAPAQGMVEAHTVVKARNCATEQRESLDLYDFACRAHLVRAAPAESHGDIP